MNLKRFSIQQKEEGRRIVNRAISMGILKEPNKCGLCGQTEGIIEYLICDYRPQNIIRSVKPLCFTCHRMLLSKHKFKEQSNTYFKKVIDGDVFKPVYKVSREALKDLGISSIEMYGVDRI